MNENNLFWKKFEERIDNYWGNTDEAKESLERDILEYANANPVKFRREFEAVMFDEDVMSLGIVMDSLAEDTDNWGGFFVHVVDDILQAARESDEPNDILTYLEILYSVEDDTRPFVSDIVKRFENELDGNHLEIECAAIWVIPIFLDNPSIRNKEALKNRLIQKLNSSNWKVRFVAHESLRLSDLLPEGAKLSFMDRLYTKIFGEPPMI